MLKVVEEQENTEEIVQGLKRDLRLKSGEKIKKLKDYICVLQDRLYSLKLENQRQKTEIRQLKLTPNKQLERLARFVDKEIEKTSREIYLIKQSNDDNWKDIDSLKNYWEMLTEFRKKIEKYRWE